MRLLLIGIIFICSGVSAQEAPYLAEEDFEFKLDYDFQVRPAPPVDKVNLVEERRYSPSPLPYVKVSFTFNKFPEGAFRLRVQDNNGESIKSKKVSKVDVLDFDLGFSDDIKDRVRPHIYYVYIENKDKERLSMIKIFVEESGDFYLNDNLFGKI